MEAHLIPCIKAHVIIAESFISEMQLSECIFVPAWISPFKAEGSDEPIDPVHRLNMLRIALSDCPNFSIDDYEVLKQDISYTCDTINYFKSKFPDDILFLLIGNRSGSEVLIYGKNYINILENVQLCIAARTTEEKNAKLSVDQVFAKIESENHIIKPIHLNSPIVDISSTDIRHRIQTGKQVDFLLNPKVADYIYENKLYICKS